MDRQAPVASILSLLERVPCSLKRMRGFFFCQVVLCGVICGAQSVLRRNPSTPCTLDIQPQRGRERWPSGLRRTPGKRVGGNPSRVRILSLRNCLSISTRIRHEEFVCPPRTCRAGDVRSPEVAIAQEDATTELVAENDAVEADSAAMDSAAAPVAVEEPEPLLSRWSRKPVRC